MRTSMLEIVDQFSLKPNIHFPFCRKCMRHVIEGNIVLHIHINNARPKLANRSPVTARMQVSEFECIHEPETVTWVLFFCNTLVCSTVPKPSLPRWQVSYDHLFNAPNTSKTSDNADGRLKKKYRAQALPLRSLIHLPHDECLPPRVQRRIHTRNLPVPEKVLPLTRYP